MGFGLDRLGHSTKNSILDVVWMVLIAYCVNVILHLIIAELSYNNGGVQLVKSFEGLFAIQYEPFGIHLYLPE